MNPTRPKHDESDYLTPRQAASTLQVSTKTLARMAERGEIETYSLPSGHRRYLRHSIERLKEAS